MGSSTWSSRANRSRTWLETGGQRPPAAQAGMAAPAQFAVVQHDVPSLEALSGELMLQLQRLHSAAASASASPRHRAELASCLQAMEQLHKALLRETVRMQGLELQIFDGQVALAQAQAELQGTQAGERQARHLALHDGLTQLPNRRYFIERLEHALAHRSAPEASLAVLYLDLDGFKPINDAHGHHVGDELLRIVGTRLNRHVRNEDMVSRLGGDEFACLRTGPASRTQLSELADKLFGLVAAPMQIGNLQLTVQPSIGIAVCPADGDSASDLLRRADAAMYRAKRQQIRHAFFADPGA